MDTIHLCESLISKFSDIGCVIKYLPDNQPIEKIDFSFGLSGILIFLGVCKNLQLDSRLPRLCHQYIEKICEELSSSTYDLSLSQGLTGILFSIFLCSQNGLEYQDLLSTLETHLNEQIIKHLLLPIEKATEHHYFLHPLYLNLSGGLSGVIAYLAQATKSVERKEKNEEMLLKCTTALVQYLNREEILENLDKVPGWYTPKEETLHPQEKYKYPRGSFVFSHAYGISGYLAALTTSFEYYQDIDSIKPLMEKLAYWLLNSAEIKENNYFWPISASYEEVSIEKYEGHLNRDAWFCGIPMTALTLYKAGKLLENKELCECAEAAYLSLFRKNLKDWNLMATSLFHGRAGAMLTTYRMAMLTGNDSLKEEYHRLKEDLLRFYDPTHQFGFRAVELVGAGNYTWKDDPGLLFGAAGIALSLMTVDNLESSGWDKCLLTY